MKSLLPILLLVACIAAIPGFALGNSIIAHSGQTNPVDEGWTESIDYVPNAPPGTGSAVGVGINDNGTDTWEIATNRAWLRYIYEPSVTELENMANGWEASISLRINAVDFPPAFDANFEIASSNWVTTLLFGTDANGAPLLSYLNSWSTFAFTPVDLSALNLDSGYHTYKLSAAGDVETVSLYVDDNFVTDIAALPVFYPSWEKRILWGDTERGGVVLDAYYSSVDFTINTPDEPIPGDANNDRKVDGSDVTILAGNWQAGVDGTVEATWAMGDFNGDKKVDGSDVTILAGNWQAGVTTAAASVPEPSTLMILLSLSGMALLAWYRRR